MRKLTPQHRSNRPELVGIEITRQCNLTCPHCYTAATRKSLAEFTTEEYRALIDELAALGATTIGWTGGEPLLRHDLVDLIEYANGKGIRSGITTNGVLLDYTVAERLKAANVKIVQISLDGSTPEKNEKMRRTDASSFAKIISGIHFCREFGIRVNIAMVLGRETLPDAPAMLEFAKREGIAAVRFCGFVPQGRGKGKLVKDHLNFNGNLHRLREFVASAVDLDTPRPIFDPAVGPLPPDFSFHECLAGVSTMYITCVGDVYPCTSLLNERFKIGNVRQRAISDIWDDPRMTEIANYDRSQITGHCRDCTDFANCGGGCRGITFAHTGDLNASFPVCLRGAK